MNNAIKDNEPKLPSSEDVFQRLREALGSKTDAELARNLDIAPTTISTWRSRNVVPYEACAKVAIEKHMSLDRLVFGVNRPNDSREHRAHTLAIHLALQTSGVPQGDIKYMLRNIEAHKAFILGQIGRLIETGKYTEDEAFASIVSDLQRVCDAGLYGGRPTVPEFRLSDEK